MPGKKIARKRPCSRCEADLALRTARALPPPFMVLCVLYVFNAPLFHPSRQPNQATRLEKNPTLSPLQKVCNVKQLFAPCSQAVVLFSQTRVKRQIFETFRAGSPCSPFCIYSIFVLFFVFLPFSQKLVLGELSWSLHFCLSPRCPWIIPGSFAKCSRANFSLYFGTISRTEYLPFVPSSSSPARLKGPLSDTVATPFRVSFPLRMTSESVATKACDFWLDEYPPQRQSLEKVQFNI